MAELSEALAELGEFAEGIAYGEEAIRIAEAVDHPFSRAMAYWGIGNLYLYKGDLPKAISMLERGLEFCQTSNILLLFPRVASALGAAFALAGRSAEALPLLEQALEQAPLWETQGLPAALDHPARRGLSVSGSHRGGHD